MEYTPIVFADGTSYSPEEIGWVVEDFQAAAERSIGARRNAAKYQQRLRNGDPVFETKDVVVLTPKDEFIRKVRACHDYNWIVAVAMARNEIDPMHDVRVRLLKANRPGGSTLDIMKEVIDSTLRNPDSTYADRARVKDYLKIIEDMGKKWTPKQVTPSVNVAVINNTPANEPKEIIDVSPVGGLKKVKNG